MTALHRVDHGFVFGSAKVTALTSMERRAGSGEHVVIRVETGGNRCVDIYVSPTGRSVRVFSGGKELTAEETP